MSTATYPIKTTVSVNGLGELTGWLNEDGTRQFFNVPYGIVTKRWTNSVLRDSWPDDTWDGRFLGSASTQPKRPFYPFPMPERKHLKYDDMELTDEFDCLNLQITVPRDCDVTDRLPVIVYIHGGGFVFGTANYSILDGRHLANLMNMPTIIVTPNYRVGFYGFLASHDIGDESPDGNGNFGLIDQKHALEWVNKYISSFGGDPARILLSGQSAGGISVDTHMRAPWNHLISTCILQSGTIPICGMYTVEESDVIYQKLLAEVGVDRSLPGPERLAALRAVPTDVISQSTYEVFQGLNLPQFGVVHDGKLLGDNVPLPTPADYVNQDLSSVYHGTIVVSSCQHEGIIYDQAFKDHSVSYLVERIRKFLPSDLVDRYLAHYNVHNEMTFREKYDAMEAMTTDGVFGALPYYLAEANPDRVHVYYWDHRSQFDNPWGGYAHHSLDYMWLFGGINSILTPAERGLGQAIGQDFISFANGIPPYPVWGSEHNARRYGPDSEWSLVGGNCTARPTAWYDEIAPYIENVDRLCTDLMMRREQLVSLDFGPGSNNRVVVTQGKPLAL